MGDIPVQDQTGEESAEDTLDTDNRRQGCAQEHDTQHEDILHHGITVTTQEVARHLGNQNDTAHTESCELDDEQNPEQPVAVFAERARYSCEHHQGEEQ